MPTYILEAGGLNNDCPDFDPAGVRLRGRWDSAAVAHMPKSEGYGREVSMIRSIPGMRVELDTEKMVGRITDGLADPKNADVLEKLRLLKTRHKESGMGSEPAETKEFKLDEDGVKTWAWTMAQAKERGELTELPGTPKIPSSKVIANEWPGGRFLPRGNSRVETRVDVVGEDDDEDGGSGSGNSYSSKKRGPGRPPKSSNSTSTTPQDPDAPAAI